MSFLLVKIIRKVIKLILDNDSPKQIAFGFSLGMLIGIGPSNIVYSLIIAFIITLLNVNITASLLGAFVFSLFNFLFFPIANQIGSFILIQKQILIPFWTLIHNTSILSWLNINNTLYLGSIILGFILIYPSYFLFLKFIHYFRSTLKEKLASSKLVKSLKASPLFKWLFKIKEFANI